HRGRPTARDIQDHLHETPRTPPRCTPVFFFNDTATTEIYPLSLHDALPICRELRSARQCAANGSVGIDRRRLDRKSTRLNSSHVKISYAVFCFKKKKNT